MKRTPVLLILVAAFSGIVRAQEAAPADASATPAVDADTQAIRAAIESYVAAFNRADAEALADHWTAAGEFVTPAGEAVQGRDALQQQFAEFFGDQSAARLEVESTQIVFLSPSVAVETGIARVLRPEAEPAVTDYKAIHIKTDGGWKMDSVREQNLPAPSEATHYDKLQPLEWMIGTWSDIDDAGMVETTCRWTTNRNFITRSFKVYQENRVDLAGTQVIGWDPRAETIRSWMFDSDGGFSVGRWSHDGARWTVKTLHVMPDGRRASATNIYEPLDADQIRFRSIGRQVDGELLPNIGPVTVARATRG